MSCFDRILCSYSADSNHCYVLLQILWLLYDKEIIQEDAILKWDDEKKDADDIDKVFVKKSEEFIKVLVFIVLLSSFLKEKEIN